MTSPAVDLLDRDQEVRRLGGSARLVRLVATLVVLGLLTAGTVRGFDDAFPMGPFRMYSTRADLDAPVQSTRVEGVDRSGVRFSITDTATGLRRAEIEGQTGRFVADPALLALIADSYARRNPDRPPLVAVEVIVRRYELRSGRQTGAYTETVLAAWPATADGAAP